MITWVKPKLLKQMLKSFFVLSILFFTACSNETKYEHIEIKEDSEIYTYSCEKNFSEFNTTVQAHKAHLFLFNVIEKESQKIVDPLFKKEDVTEEFSFMDWIRLTKNVFTMQSNVKASAETIIDKFGCALIAVPEE